MGLIGNQPIPAESQSPQYTRRVVVKFRPDAQLPYSPEVTAILAKRADRDWQRLQSTFPGMSLTPYFATIEESVLRAMEQRVAGAKGMPTAAAFTSYFAVDCPPGTSPERIAQALNGWDLVDIAYAEGGPTPPPLDPSDDPRNTNQGYLGAAPIGIDARAMWGLADGSGIGFVDLEQGWLLNHQDLTAAGISIISGLNRAYHSHGTAVLGEVVAVDNTLGGIGIAPGANTRVVSQWRSTTSYNTAEAILSAVAAMSAGDVLLLEAQTSYSTATGYVPVEVEQAVFDAIAYATAQGVVVVEAGGNGSVDLDGFQDVLGRRILNRGHPDFRDSGAIMVGAASSGIPHSRLSFSNFGTRIDCYAWGENIDTCGGSATTYTTGFGGTSGASPMITGAAVLLQSWRVDRGQPRYTPADLRTMLSDPLKNTASANPATDRIGVMPNLRAIAGIRRFPKWPFVLAWAWMILIGGLLITPGGTWCIRCGPTHPGYLGDTVIFLLGVVAVALGIAGFAGRRLLGIK